MHKYSITKRVDLIQAIDKATPETMLHIAEDTATHLLIDFVETTNTASKYLEISATDMKWAQAFSYELVERGDDDHPLFN